MLLKMGEVDLEVLKVEEVVSADIKPVMSGRGRGTVYAEGKESTKNPN